MSRIAIILLLSGTGRLGSTWPWMDAPGTISASLWAGYTRGEEKFGSGNFSGRSIGEKIPVFESTPGVYINNTLDVFMSAVPVENLEIGLNLHLAKQTWDWELPNQEEAGLGDTRLYLKYQILHRVPVNVSYQLVIPTGSSVNDAESISLGKGSFAQALGLSTGVKYRSRLFLYSRHEIIYQSPRTQSARRNNNDTGRYETVELGEIRKRASWQGSVSFFIPLGKLKMLAHYCWLLSQEQVNTIGVRTSEPGFAYHVFKPEVMLGLGKSSLIGNIAVPLAGVEMPAGLKYQLGYAYKFNVK